MLTLSTGKQFGVFNVAEIKAVGSVFISLWVLWLPRAREKYNVCFAGKVKLIILKLPLCTVQS